MPTEPATLYAGFVSLGPEWLKANRQGWEDAYQVGGITYNEYIALFDMAYPGQRTGAVATTGTAGPSMTGATARMPTEEELKAIRGEAQNWQALYEQQYGIPTAGRSPYQAWLAQQWQTPAAEYALRAAGVAPAGTPGIGAQTFPEYLGARQGSPATMGAGYLQALAARTPEQQRVLYETLPNYVQPEALYGGLAGKMPAWLAQQQLAQQFGEPAQRRYGIRAEAISGADTFLNYLAQRFGL